MKVFFIKFGGIKMNSFILLIPFIIIRFFLLAILNKNDIERAAYFSPMIGIEKFMYFIYQISNIGIFVYMILLKIKIEQSLLFYNGLIIYVCGIILLTIAIINFSNPSNKNLNINGLYSLSRNPMYVTYFIYFIGCVALTQSIMLLILVLTFQITSHWIILSEERWCIKKFGNAYLNYMKNVRRYI